MKNCKSIINNINNKVKAKQKYVLLFPFLNMKPLQFVQIKIQYFLKNSKEFHYPYYFFEDI